MKAISIKLDGVLLKELKELKGPRQDLTTLIHELLKAQIRLQKMARAAEEFQMFMHANADESLENDGWATTNLDRDRCSAS